MQDSSFKMFKFQKIPDAMKTKEDYSQCKIDKCKVHVQVQDKFKQGFLTSTSTSGSRQIYFRCKLTSSNKGSKTDSRQISFPDD